MVTKRALHPSARQDPTQSLNLRLTLPNVLSSSLATSPPAPQKGKPIVSKKYPAKQHCQTVSSRLAPTVPGLIYLPGQTTSYPPYSDQPNPFRQLRHFFYLSGCDLADTHLTYDIARDKLTLYIPPLDPREVLWTGMPPSREDCLEKFDVDEVRFSTFLREDLDKWVVGVSDVVGFSASAVFGVGDEYPSRGGGGVVYCLDRMSLPPPPNGVLGLGLDENALAECGWGWTSLRGVVIDTEKVIKAIDDSRVYKDAYEIALLRKAIDVTRKGHLAVMDLLKKKLHTHSEHNSEHHSHHNLTEADLEAAYRSSCISSQAKIQAYDPIVCSGRSCATLHYTANDAPLKNKQLLLIDAGAEWSCYAADITRTYPINGRWTKEAKAVYDIVDKMQRECIKKTVAGVSWRETHFLAAKIAVDGLIELGVFKKSSGSADSDELQKQALINEIFTAGTWRAFFPHGLGHMLGLETHDVDGTPDDKSGYDPHLSSLSSTSPYPLSHHKHRPSHLPPCPSTNPTTLVNRVLKPNMVLTVEPGIYFCEWIIKPYLSDPKHKNFIDESVLNKFWDVGGVRIEDVILVKEEGKGNEVLSKDIPKGW